MTRIRATRQQVNSDRGGYKQGDGLNISPGWLCGGRVACYLLPLIPRPVGRFGPHEPKIQMEDRNTMKAKQLTTKQKRDRRWKIKRRKLRREKHGL